MRLGGVAFFLLKWLLYFCFSLVVYVSRPHGKCCSNAESVCGVLPGASLSQSLCAEGLWRWWWGFTMSTWQQGGTRKEKTGKEALPFL